MGNGKGDRHRRGEWKRETGKGTVTRKRDGKWDHVAESVRSISDGNARLAFSDGPSSIINHNGAKQP